MKVMHLVKTSVGASWACRQVHRLVELGVEAHVVLPSMEGDMVPDWRATGAILHVQDCDMPVHRPDKFLQLRAPIRRLIDTIGPDIIHSHFAGTTLLMRAVLGHDHPVPRVFQVPGPLHMEHRLYRTIDVSSAGPRDYWIGSSRYIYECYRRAGVPETKVFMSYYGSPLAERMLLPDNSWDLRAAFGIPPERIVVGNVNLMYPPKRYLGQTVGLKCHEDVIDALAEVTRQDDRVVGVLVGGAWGNAAAYERKLRARARAKAGDRIVMTGLLHYRHAYHAWNAFDLAVHVPLSENCGGAMEPLLHEVPVIAGRVGALPEFVVPGQTGYLVEPRDPSGLARTIREAVGNLEQGRAMARRGARLARTMFNGRRTGDEILAIYNHILNGTPTPPRFDTLEFLNGLARDGRDRPGDGESRAPRFQAVGQANQDRPPRMEAAGVAGMADMEGSTGGRP